jgi:AraC-like DNA-binding protein
MVAVADGMEERRQFWRSPFIPGFELFEAKASTAPFQVYNVEYTIGVPVTWAGHVNHDGQPTDLSAGRALLLRPGEFLSTPGAPRPGDLRVMILSQAALQQYAGEYLKRPAELEWKASVPRCSKEMLAAFHRVYADLHSAPTAMQFQSTMTTFFSVMVQEMVAGVRPSRTLTDGSRQAERMRELMHHSPEGLTMGLAELAEGVGMTRFRALRAFKRKYGVPPHAYQLAVRVGLAAPLLMRGDSVTRVAHTLGFSDQSHFTRHFKRLWRVTPGNYRHQARPIPFARSPSCTAQSDGVLFSI